MTEERVTDLISRYERLYSDQSNFRILWQDLADYILPRKSNILSLKSAGSKQTERLFDSTAIHANELLAASMATSLTPSNARWFYLKTRDPGLNEDDAVKEWLEDCSDRMDRVIHQSNFASEVNECRVEFGCFGIAALFCEEKPLSVEGFSGINFKSFSVGEYVISEDYAGRVNMIIRKFELPAVEAMRKFKKNVGEKVAKAAASSNDRDKLFPFLWAVMPMEDWRSASRKKKVLPYASCYVNLSEKSLIQEGGYHEFPVMVPRWAKASNEVYGRGPGFTALPDVRTLNKAIELDLRAWAKAIDPPLLVKDGGVIGSVRVTPSGITYVRQLDQIKTLESTSKFDVTQIKVNDLRSSIRRIFFSDQLQLQESPKMTASEVYVRYELMQRILGPTLGREESEELSPLIERVFGIMSRGGAFREPPDALKQRSGEDLLDVEYEGPMARAQRLGELNALQKFYSFVGPISAVQPEVLDIVDTDKAAREVADVTGVPAKIIRDEDQVKAIRQQRGEAKAKADQAQGLMAIAQGLGKAAPAMQAMNDMMAQGPQPQAGVAPPALPTTTTAGA